MYVRPKKIVFFPQIGRVKIFSSLTRPDSRMCIRIYIFRFKQKKQTHTNKQKAKETKEIKKQKNSKKKRRKKMLLAISVENLARYDDIV